MLQRFVPPAVLRWALNGSLIMLAVLVAFGAFRVVTKDRTVKASKVPIIAATDTPAADQPVKSVFFGDSIIAGANAGVGNPTFTEVAARLLGWRQNPFGYPGTGFTTGGHFKGGRDYLARIQQLRGYDVRVIVIEGGLNDGSADQTTLSTAASAVLDAAHQLVPRATIVLMGPWSPSGTPTLTAAATAKTLRALAAARSVPYIDPIGEHWVTGSYPKTGNAAELISGDGFYPNAKGHAFFGQKVADDLRRLLPATLFTHAAG